MDSRQVSIEKAESLYGSRLDRRRNYAVIDNEVCELLQYTGSCSGCLEGSGCVECGYTGKRRHKFWSPLETNP